jgi:chromosome segregation ATPase
MLTQIATALAGLGAGGFGVWRLIKREKREDTTQSQADAIHAHMTELLTGMKAELKELRQRADDFAQERNVERERAARLEVEVRHLQIDLTKAQGDLISANTRISHLEGERDAARDLLKQAEMMYRIIKDEHEALKKENDTMRRTLARLRRSPESLAALAEWAAEDIDDKAFIAALDQIETGEPMEWKDGKWEPKQ